MYREIHEPSRAIFEGIIIIADERIPHEKLSEVWYSLVRKPNRGESMQNLIIRPEFFCL